MSSPNSGEGSASQPPNPDEVPSLQPPALSDFDTIKIVLIPFRQLWNTIILNSQAEMIEGMTLNEGAGAALGYPVFTLYANGLFARRARGPAALPADTSPALQLSILKINMYDLAVHPALPYLTTALQKICARVAWLVVGATSKCMFHYFPDEVRQGLHSVFIVTSTTGNQYIADFTLEQFDFEANMWFVKENDYYDQVTDKQYWRLADQDCVEEIEGSIARHSAMLSTLLAVQEVAGYVDKAEYEELGEEDKEAWLKDRTRFAGGFLEDTDELLLYRLAYVGEGRLIWRLSQAQNGAIRDLDHDKCL
jgi:hypothetical protein